ncbi:YgfZ/GcvT domain-containing protein [Catenovulum adriaticum]|uniref:tRNA-modifying protein YgfZ-like beta-barrel domain-containing protein n=1 Tax=Catenovulum adriaticum TaxID=2984846 RepID=A0ABY7AW12_9ALTE|nr:hypothetical protein [Catenovulum sp. TS8]WAJ72401.1 hypothetical protein OLW01_16835 [Catenovulum sp. TS8]
MSISHIRLSNWQAISIKGQDQTTYLNSQVTCDVAKLGEQDATFGCHCDAKGKTWSLFYLMPVEQNFLLFQKTSSIAASAQALQKFGVFSKVEIQAPTSEWKISALQGESLIQWLNKQGLAETPLNQVTPIFNGYLCLMSQDLGLFVRASDAELPAELAQLDQQDTAYFDAKVSQHVWPFIEVEHQSEYIPQMLNAHAIGAISFKKGCYMGQETVARMRYLGKNKKASFGFSSEDPIELGSTLEIQAGSGWRRAGEVIHSCQLDQKTFGIAVLAADTNITTSIRVKDDSSKTVQLSALPYSLEYEESK